MEQSRETTRDTRLYTLVDEKLRNKLRIIIKGEIKILNERDSSFIEEIPVNDREERGIKKKYRYQDCLGDLQSLWLIFTSSSDISSSRYFETSRDDRRCFSPPILLAPQKRKKKNVPTNILEFDDED